MPLSISLKFTSNFTVQIFYRHPVLTEEKKEKNKLAQVPLLDAFLCNVWASASSSSYFPRRGFMRLTPQCQTNSLEKKADPKRPSLSMTCSRELLERQNARLSSLPNSP